MALHALLAHTSQPNIQGDVGKRSPGHSGGLGKVLLCALKRSTANKVDGKRAHLLQHPPIPSEP